MPKKLAILASKGTLDGAYPPFILASTAVALGYEVKIFFTFYSLQLLKKELSLAVSPLGNPAMPITLPTFIQILPGVQWILTRLMHKKIKQKGIASIEELREICIESGVELIACQMALDLFDFNKDEFVEGVSYAGAASFLEFASEAETTLYM